MKLLVVGGNGNYAGLATEHLAKKHDLTVFDIKPDPCAFPCRYINGNVKEYSQISQAMQGMEAIVTFFYGDVALSSSGMLNVLTAAEENNIPHVVYTSSGGMPFPALAYAGKHPVYSMHSFSADFWKSYFPMTEETGMFPGQENAPYFYNKWLCEELGKLFVKRGKLAFTAIRPGLLMRDDMTNIRPAEYERNFDPFMMLMTGQIRVADLARLIDLALAKRPAGFEAFHASNDTPYNNLSVEKAKRMLGFEVEDPKPYLDFYQSEKMNWKSAFEALAAGGFPAETLRALHAFRGC